MKPLLSMLGSRSEKQDYRHIITNDEEESLASEEQTFLPQSPQVLMYQRPTALDTIRSVLVLALLASGIGLVLLMAVKQTFPTIFAHGHSAPMASNVAVMNPASEVMVQPCGTSAHEAREHGCVFDNIAFAWFPPRCWDEDLSKAFRDHKFNFSMKPDGVDPVPQDQAYTGDYPQLYVNWEYHVMHCTYMWRKMHRAILGQGRFVLDGVAKDMQHTTHCETMLLRRQDVPYEAMNSVLSVKYPDCGA